MQCNKKVNKANRKTSAIRPVEKQKWHVFLSLKRGKMFITNY